MARGGPDQGLPKGDSTNQHADYQPGGVFACVMRGAPEEVSSTQQGESFVMNKVAAKFLVAACMLGLAGCSATPTKPADSVPSVVYNKPEAAVQKAAVDALVANGFVISKSDAEYVEGARPHKMGLVVGSGGESAGVWLSSQGGDKTWVKVSTAKSFAGMAGQKNWDKEIIAEMDKSIGTHQ